MDYPDTPEQAALRDTVRAFFARPPGADTWKRLTTELGLTGLAVPERFGGAGATLAEVAVAVAEAGRVLLPLPFLSTALAGAVLAHAALADPVLGEPAGEVLAGIADGSLRAAFVFGDGISVAEGRLSGVARHVLDGAEADVFLVRAGAGLYVARADAVTPVGSLDQTTPRAAVTQVGTLDQTRSQATVTFADLPAEPAGADPDRAENLLRIMLAVESAATAEHCLDVTVEYLKTRVQFGRAIGTFQALRHRCADLAVEVASARATARAAVHAAVAAAEGPDQFNTAPERLPVLAPLAKLHCADVFWHVAAEMVQLHGGIGFTWEHEAHRYLKRAKTTQLLHGSPAELRRLIAQRAGLT